jgi:predicted nucleotidyltransferase component of viral defense system
MRYDVRVLSEIARRHGYVRNTLEKIFRLTAILKFINQDRFLNDKLALKGGTAINLLYDDLPRLSVDIDFDYAINDNKDTMLKNRMAIRDALETFFTSEGYVLNKNTRFAFSLDSLVVSYVPSGGGFDNIKVEINYSMRGHLLPLERKEVKSAIIDSSFDVLAVSKLEIYAGKINALMSRSQIRDLFDTYRMVQLNLLTENDMTLLKDIILFYRFIQSGFHENHRDHLNKHNQRGYLRDLLPVLRKGDSFHLDEAKQIVIRFLNQMTTYDERHRAFIESTKLLMPNFELLFLDPVLIERAMNHPMTLWKTRQYVIEEAMMD